MQTLNESFIRTSASDAMKGLTTLGRTTLHSGMVLHRFGSSLHPDRIITGPWWVGFTPFEQLCACASTQDVPLSLAARQCLAIDWGWSRVDVLIKVKVLQPLFAWSGTPKTQVVRPEPQRVDLHATPGRTTELRPQPKASPRMSARWEPDRRITQLFIPGLFEADPKTKGRKIWQSALLEQSRIVLPCR